jgi:carbonic anhydrase
MEAATVGSLQRLFENNRRWADRMLKQDREFFSRLVDQQAPRFLWIGCADSRVPANEIVGLQPGELFVHRNVANLVHEADLNCLSVLQYAIDVLRVDHVIVCGHYGCGGVQAVLAANPLGLVDRWLDPIRRLCERHRAEIDALAHASEKADRLCELNVREQVRQVGRTAPVQEAWRRGQLVSIHGWIYSLNDGLLRDLACSIDTASSLT